MKNMKAKRSARIIAVVLLVATLGGTLLGRKKEDKKHSMEYIDVPTWTSAPYYQVEEFLYPETRVCYTEGFNLKDDTSHPACLYSIGDHTYFQTGASFCGSEIAEALITEKEETYAIHFGNSLCAEHRTDDGQYQNQRDANAFVPVSEDEDLTGMLEGWVYDEYNPIIVNSNQPLNTVEEEVTLYSSYPAADLAWDYPIDGYYTVAPGTEFTVKNNATCRDATVNIWLCEFKKHKGHDATRLWDAYTETCSDVDLNGQYYSTGYGAYLSTDLSGDPAGEGLSWVNKEDGIALYADWYPDMVFLYPAQSITFRVPESKDDVIYRVIFGYVDSDDPDGVECAGYPAGGNH